ncbi:MAG: hypothetical protein RI967_558 [Planctomycetota bacterium]
MVATAPFRLDLLTSEQNPLADRLRCVTLAHGSGNGNRLDFVFIRPTDAGGASADGGVSARTRLFVDDDESVLIEEVSASGSVPMLKATNRGDTDLLLLAGQIVRGGKQNRGINADILILAGQSAMIPVTCVEQGRWSGDPRSRFRHAGIEPLSIRAGKMRNVHSSIRTRGSHEANQGEVWEKVSMMQRAFAVHSPSSDLLESMSAATGPIGAGATRRPRQVHPAAQALLGGGLEEEGIGEEPDGEREFGGEPGMGRGWPRPRLAGPHSALVNDPRLPREQATVIRDAFRALEREALEMLRQRRLAIRNFAGLPRAELADRLASERASQEERERRTLAIRAELDALVERATRFLAEQPPIAQDTVDGVQQKSLDHADAEARLATGALVFLDGEFLTGDLFADSAWFARFYGDLRHSAIASWRELEMRGTARDPRRAPATEDDASIVARAASVLRDAAAGHWVERKAPAHGRLWTLEHPFLECSTTTSAGVGATDEPLHLLIGTRHEPEVFRRTRAR